MEAIEIVEGLAGVRDRGGGTDAERRAAAWLAAQVSRDAQIETFWCRPNWALAHAVHAALAVAGSLVSLISPAASVAILGATLGSIGSDWLLNMSLGRRLTREHASQNVLVSPAPAPSEKPVRLILTANYDAGRAGLVFRDWLRGPTASLSRALKPFTPGWLGWLAIATIWLLAVAISRLEGQTSHAVAAAQLPPTVALIVGFALLLDLASARWSPSVGDNATGVGVAVALAQALETAPPQHLEVELVLTGAGDGDQLGLRRYLRTHRGERKALNTVVLGLAACAAGTPRWWFSDGSLIPLRYAAPLRELARQIAAEEPHLGTQPHRGRGSTPALPARSAGIPAITLGCLEDRGFSPHTHQLGDSLAAVDTTALDAALQFALLMIDAIDSAIGDIERERAVTPA